MNIFKAIWKYFVSMNSEPNGTGVSIKRNVAFAIAAIMILVEAGAMIGVYYLVKDTPAYLSQFVYLSIFLSVLDAIMILLVLQITSIEKLKDIAMQLKPGIFNAPAAAPVEVKKEEPTDAPEEAAKPE